MASKENLRIRIGPERKARLDALLERKKITQQDAVIGIVDSLLILDDKVQSMLLGQLAPESAEQLSRLILEEMASGRTVQMTQDTRRLVADVTDPKAREAARQRLRDELREEPEGGSRRRKKK